MRSAPEASAAPAATKAGERVAITGSIANTYLDGSRVVLRVDGQSVAAKWAWARNGRKQELTFPLQVDQPGWHEVTVGDRKLELTVAP